MTMRIARWCIAMVAAGVLGGFGVEAPSGVVRVMEQQEAGHAYIKP